ncbi:MAG: UvrD-helicase domain-containing protein [Propioniciclava sp.]
MRRLTDPVEVSEVLGIPFSDQQLAAISAPLEPGVIIAGAGTGKTTVMAARVVWLVGSGIVRPEEVLGLTFTRKAAGELSARVRRALTTAGVVDDDGLDNDGEPRVLTYDAFAARLVSEHGIRIGVDADARLITGAARFRLASRAVASAAGPFQQLARLRPDSIVDKVMALDGELSAHLVPSGSLIDHTLDLIDEVEQAPLTRAGSVYASLRRAATAAAERVELAGLVDSYQRIKRSHQVVEFADQMAVAARLATDVPAVGRTLREQFRVVLLDEYQDTSSAQAALLGALFSGAAAAAGRGHAVTAVGDPCQAIYGWRGAAAANIIAFAEEFPRADGSPAARYALTVNRRSGTAILRAANRLAAPLRQDEELAWDGIDTDLVAPPGTPPGDITVATFDTWADEVTAIVDRIVAAHDSGQVPRWAEIAVLCRRNSFVRAVYAALVDRDVPVEIVGLDGLLQVPEVADVVAMLRVLADATANPDLVRILSGPRWAIGPADLAVLGRRARELVGERARDREMTTAEEIAAIVDETTAARAPSLAEAVASPGPGPYTSEARTRLSSLAAELASLRRHADAPVTEVVRRVITALGLEVECGLRGADGLRQLDAFVAQVAGYADVDGDGSLAGLLAWIRAEEDHGVGLEQAVPTPVDSVKLLTIHKAKGLEWDLVVLPALADRIFPSQRIGGNWLTRSDVLPADLRGDAANVAQLADVTDPATKEYETALRAEARRGDDRLAYVAVTRARKHLVATTHTWADVVQSRMPSPYLRTLTECADIVEHAEVSPANPLPAGGAVPWPEPPDLEAGERRRWAAEAVAEARRRRASAEPVRAGADPDEHLPLDEAAQVATWDDARRLLLDEARRRRSGPVQVLPAYLSTTALISLDRDAAAYLAQANRPMPRPPRPSARVGERFHAWLERRFAAAPTLLPADPDDAEAPDDDLESLIGAFERSPYASLTPVATEIPFSLFLGGRVVRGRIDAVFAEGSGFVVVDWKTGDVERGHPLQLAVYRVAWAEMAGVGVDQVDAVFYDVPKVRVVRPGLLGDRTDLERVVAGVTGPIGPDLHP